MLATMYRATFATGFWLVLATLAPLASAEPPAWNAEEVTALAVKLDAEIEKLLEMAPAAPPQETAFQQRTRDAAVEDTKRAREASRRLVEKLHLGWDRDETETHFQLVTTALREVRTTAGDAVPSFEARTILTRIEGLQRELAKRYERP